MSNFTVTVSETTNEVTIQSSGLQGEAGPGVATGGTTGQFLKKSSGTDYATTWSGIALDDLTDVDADGPAENEVLCWNGTAWINAPSHGVGSTAVSDAAYSSDWNGVTTYAPSKNAVFDKVEALDAAKANASHTHAISDVTGLQTALDGKAASSHTHTASEVTDFNTAADARAALKVSDTAYNSSSWDSVTTIAPSKNSVRDKIEALDAAKANASHTHTASEVTDFNTAADARVAAKISDTAYDATSWNGVTDTAPSKNSVRDQVETMLTSIAAKALASDLSAHTGDTTGAHAASAISVTPTGNLSADDVQEALEELQTSIDNINTGAGTGDVVGPASATDNGIARYDGTTGKLLQNSGATIDDSGNIAATNLSGTNTGDQDLSGYVTKALFDANTIIAATSDDTPAALTVGEQTVVGRATGGAITALAIDSDLSSVSGSDNTIPSAKATKAALDAKAAVSHTHTASEVTDFNTAADARVAAKISDTAYDATSWNAVTDIAPSKNAVRDQVEVLVTSIAGKAASSHTHTASEVTDFNTAADARAALKVSDTAYNASSWDTVTTIAPSKNAVRDKIEALDAAKANTSHTHTAAEVTDFDTAADARVTAKISDTAYDATSWNTNTDAPTKNAVRDQVETMLTSIAAKALASDLTTHVADTANPHAVTKTQVGLGNVANVDVTPVSITFVIDGGGSAITTGIKGDLEIPFACTITGWTIVADQSGSCVVDVWKDSYANYPPVVGDSIAGSEKPTLSTAVKNQDLTLSTWTTSVSAGDTLRFNVDSASTVTRVTIALRATRT